MAKRASTTRRSRIERLGFDVKDLEITSKGLSRISTLSGKRANKGLSEEERRELAFLNGLAFFLGKKKPRSTPEEVVTRSTTVMTKVQAIKQLEKALKSGYAKQF